MRLTLAQPRAQSPNKSIRVAPFRLALDDEGLAADGELVVGARIGDLARTHLEGRSLGLDTSVPEADVVSGAARSPAPAPDSPAGCRTASMPTEVRRRVDMEPAQVVAV